MSTDPLWCQRRKPGGRTHFLLKINFLLRETVSITVQELEFFFTFYAIVGVDHVAVTVCQLGDLNKSPMASFQRIRNKITADNTLNRIVHMNRIVHVNRLVHINCTLHMKRIVHMNRTLHMNRIVHMNRTVHVICTLHMNLLVPQSTYTPESIYEPHSTYEPDSIYEPNSTYDSYSI